MADFLKALLLKVSKNPWFLFWIVFPEVQLRRTMLVHTKIVKCIKEDLGKFAEIRGDYSFSIYAKFFEKIKFFCCPEVNHLKIYSFPTISGEVVISSLNSGSKIWQWSLNFHFFLLNSESSWTSFKILK